MKRYGTVVAVAAGFGLGAGGLGAIHLDGRSTFVGDLAIVALVVILFRDGIEVEREMLPAWRMPLRKLVLAMPITAVLVAITTHALTGLDWLQSFLVGALLSPTDPVLTSSVVTNPRVPSDVRHSLNLESGFNDGLALPAVLALVAAIASDEFTWWTFVLQDVGLGLAYGMVIGAVASRVVPRAGAARTIGALAAGGLAYGATVLPLDGNGLIAVFSCAIVLAVLRADVREGVSVHMAPLVEVVKVAIFAVFGMLLSADVISGAGWAGAGVVAVLLLGARPVAVWLALAGARTPGPVKAFMAWFGPKGVATLAFALLVLHRGVDGAQEIFDICALAVLVSVIAHGLTDHPGAEWMARRAAPPAPGP